MVAITLLCLLQFRYIQMIALTKTPSIIYQLSWITREVPFDWRLVNVTPIYKKSLKEDSSKYRPVSLISV